MIYTYPIFLWGFTALIIPIIVHLFNFRKVKKISFSNVHFLENIKKKTSSSQRIRHLLILLCRLLCLFFLVITFAQPFIPGAENGLKGKNVSLFLDNSYSMSNLTNQDISGFNEMLTIAEQVVQLYPEETMFNLITNDFTPESNNLRSKYKTIEKITEIEYSHTSRSGEEIINKMLAHPSSASRDIFILSDFQKSTIGHLGSVRDSINQYHIVPISLESDNNIYVDTIYLNSPFLIPNQPNSLNIRFKNRGEETVNDLSVKLHINGRQSGTTNINLNRDGLAEINFPLSGNLKNVNQCKISFEDYPVAFDNNFLFTLNQISKINIVEIKGSLAITPIEKVFDRHALFKFSSFLEANISYQKIGNSDLLIINQVNEFSPSLVSQVELQLSKGRAVIFVPAEASLNPAQLSGLSLYIAQDTASTSLNVPDINNPFYENIFETMDSDTQMPWLKTTVRWDANGIDLLRTKTGQSFLSHISGKGNLYLFSTPIADDYTNFHKHALFVPVMQRIAELASTNSQALYYNLNISNISIQVDSILKDQLYRMKLGDSELIPSQRISSNQLIMNMPRYLIQPGFYELTLGNKIVNVLAFNHSPKESKLATMSVEEIASKISGIKNLKIFEEANSNSFYQIMKDKYHSRELWKYALVLSLIFLLAESVLIRFF